MIRSLLLASTLALAACQPATSASETDANPTAAPASVTVSDAWCRPTPNGGRVAGCYVTLTAATDDRLVGSSSPAAATLQLHEMSTEGGMMKMGEIQGGLPLPGGQSVTLAPGGNHLMLIGLTAPLVEGATVPVTFDFATAADVTVQAAVRQPAA